MRIAFETDALISQKSVDIQQCWMWLEWSKFEDMALNSVSDNLISNVRFTKQTSGDAANESSYFMKTFKCW